MQGEVPLSFTVKSVSESHQSQLLFRLILSIRNFAHVPSMATPPLPGGGTTIKNLPLSPPPPHGLTRVCMCVCAWNSLRRPPRGRVGRGRRRIEKRRVPPPPSFLAVPRRLPLHATSRRHRPQSRGGRIKIGAGEREERWEMVKTGEGSFLHAKQVLL